MKFKTTFSEIKNKAFLSVGIGYCDIQNIERYLDACAYSAGVYGWKCDFYEFGNRVISTGYNPLDWGYNKTAKYACGLIRADLLKLNKKIDAKKYAFLKTGDFYKASARVKKMVEKIIEKNITKATAKFGY